MQCLDAKLGLLIACIQTVGHRDHADAAEVELRHDGQHEVIVPGQARQVIDQDHIEFLRFAGGKEGCKPLPVRPRALPTGTSTDTERRGGIMASSRYLLRRGLRWYFRLHVPQELQPFLGRDELRKSLRTSCYPVAKSAASGC